MTMVMSATKSKVRPTANPTLGRPLTGAGFAVVWCCGVVPVGWDGSVG